MVLESQVDTISFKLKKVKVVAWEVEESAMATEAKSRAIEVGTTSVGAWAIEEYKKSKDFLYKVSKATYDVY